MTASALSQKGREPWRWGRMVGIALVSGILCLGVIASLVEQAEREVDAVDAVQQETVTLPDPRPIEADLVASYGGQSRGLAATASALYLAQGKRIESADLTDADHPRFNSTLAFTESVTALGLIQGYLLAGVGRRLVVLGLSDPLRPQPLVQIELARVAQKLTIDSSLARVYVLGQTPPGVSLDVDVIDLAEPRAPRHLGSMGLWQARDLAAGNGALYVTTRTDPGQVLAFDARGTALPVASPWSDVQRDVSQVTILDGQLYARISPVKGPEQLVTYDVSQPLQPQLLGQRVLTSQPMQQWVGHRGRLYGTVMQDSRGLESTLLSLDVDSRQGTPALTGRARFYGELQALIALDDHLFGVTNGCGLKVFRVPTEGRGAEAMVEVPVSETVPIAGSIAQVASEGNGVWAAGYAYQTCNRVDRLDLSIPMQPHRRSIIPLRGPLYSLELTSDSLAAGVGLWFGSPPLLHLWPRNGPNDEPPKVLTAEYPAQLLAYDKRRDHLYVAARHVGWRDSGAGGSRHRLGRHPALGVGSRYGDDCRHGGAGWQAGHGQHGTQGPLAVDSALRSHRQAGLGSCAGGHHPSFRSTVCSRLGLAGPVRCRRGPQGLRTEPRWHTAPDPTDHPSPGL